MSINILIADDQIQHLDRLRDYWKKALGSSPQYEITHDLKEVENKLNRRPHIVIIDNQFEKSSNDGAKFIAKHKEYHPDTVFVLMTGQGFDIDQLGQRIPNPDFLVPKPYLLNDKYLKYIGGAIISALNRASAVVNIPGSGLDLVSITNFEFSSLVEQCLFSLEILEFDLSAEPKVAFELLSGGYSGAIVYKMTVIGSGRSASLPLILKCGKRKQIDTEIRAFERWVRWQLPPDMRVDIIGKGATGDHAAICYGFALGSTEGLKTLSEAVRGAEFDVVHGILKRIYLAKRTGWYRSCRQTDEPLCKSLMNSDEYDPDKDDKRNKRLYDAISNISQVEKISYIYTTGDHILAGKSYGNVRRVTSLCDQIKTLLAYCHGDLNANNIFHNSGVNSIAMIDFEQAGERHIFRDFISVETSIRMNLAYPLTDSIGTLELIKLEKAHMNNLQNQIDGDYWKWISLPRQLGFEVYSGIDVRSYVLPLVFHSWKVLGIKSWDYEIEKRLASVILAGLSFLDSP